MYFLHHQTGFPFSSTAAYIPFHLSEFLSGGSMYDFLHKQKGSFSLQSLLKVAVDISRGMKYLHQNNIIHRDLKAANLLMDGNGVRDILLFSSCCICLFL